MGQKCEHSARVYCVNPNGFQLDKGGGKWALFCGEMKDSQADIACANEINLNTRRHEVQSEMHAICNRPFHQTCLVTASTPIPSKSSYKPGGTCMFTVNNLTSRIINKGSDPKGRWCWTKYRSRPDETFLVVTAYQVCSSSIKKGSTTAAAQQDSLLRAEASTTDTELRAPRPAFCQDLTRFVQSSQADGSKILLVGDFNEPLGVTDNGMTNLARDCGIFDVYCQRLGTSLYPSTYINGKRRLDYALASPSVLAAVTRAGYDPYNYRVAGDHRGFFLDLDTRILFSSDTPSLAPPSQRSFSAQDPASVVTYVNAKAKYLRNHNFSARIKRLETRCSIPTSWNNWIRICAGPLSTQKINAANVVRPHGVLLYIMLAPESISLSCVCHISMIVGAGYWPYHALTG